MRLLDSDLRGLIRVSLTYQTTPSTLTGRRMSELYLNSDVFRIDRTK